MALASPSRRSYVAETPRDPANRIWISPLVVLPAFTPPPVHLLRPLPEHRSAPSGRRFHASTHVPPSWFRTTSTVYSAPGLRVCCASLPAWGSLRFQRARPHHRNEPRLDAPWRRQSLSPQRGSDPSKGSLANSRVASLRPLPSCRCCATAGVAPSPTTVASGRRQRRCDDAADSRALLR